MTTHHKRGCRASCPAPRHRLQRRPASAGYKRGSTRTTKAARAGEALAAGGFDGCPCQPRGRSHPLSWHRRYRRCGDEAGNNPSVAYRRQLPFQGSLPKRRTRTPKPPLQGEGGPEGAGGVPAYAQKRAPALSPGAPHPSSQFSSRSVHRVASGRLPSNGFMSSSVTST